MFNFILGLVIIAAGAFMTIKSEAFFRNFGRIDFFERYLANSGGSRFGYKLTGIIIVFFGALIAFGLIAGFLNFVLAPLLRFSH